MQFSVHARMPQIGDTLVFSGDGWEPQSPYARAHAQTHVHTDTIPQVNMGLVRSPNFVSGSAGWQIKEDGSAEFNDVVVRGTIYASAGSIGGWTITTGHLYAGTGAARVGLRPADYPFYAGAENPAAAPFRVTAAGALVATSATITGTITATSGTIGGWDITATQIQATDDVVLLDSAGIITVGGAGYLTSDPFTSGTLGWRITPTEAEFGNITARGEIRTAVFKYNEVHAQAGQLLVTPNAAKLDTDLTIAASGSFDVGETGRFTASDIVRLKDGTGDVWLTIVADVGDGTYTYTRSSGSAVGTVFRCGTAVVGYGASGEGGIVLDAVTANGPFLDIFTHAGAPWTTLTTKVRVGNLAGITDTDLSPTGYGFYSDNAYLKGALVAGGGAVKINTNGVDIDFNPGGSTAARVKMYDFDAAHDGYVYWYAYVNDTAFVDAITSMLDVKGDVSTGDNPNAIYIVSAQGKGQTQFVGSGGTGLKLQSWETPLGTYYGMVIGADDTIARVQSYGAGWIDLEPDGDILIRSYLAGGDVQAQLSDAAGVSQLEVLDSAGAEVAYIDSDGKVLAALDVHPGSAGRGLMTRLANRAGIATYDNHFTSGVIPSGYAWQGAPFGGTPVALQYSRNGDYLGCTADAGGTKHFMSIAVANAAASWQNKYIWARLGTGAITEIGVRLDDGTDNNYAEIFMTGAAVNATQTLSFRYRIGGAAATTVTSAIVVPVGELYTVRLVCVYAAPNYSVSGYLVGEDGSAINITTFTTGTVTWMPAAGRVGIFCKDAGNYGLVDVFARTFT